VRRQDPNRSSETPHAHAQSGRCPDSSPISESGERNVGSDGGDLFVAVQRAIGSSNSSRELPAPPKAAYGRIALPQSVALLDHLDALSTCHEAVAPSSATLPSMEQLGSWYGLVLYETAGAPFGGTRLNFSSRTLHDRVQVFVDGAAAGSAYRAECPQSVDAPAGDEMRLLVENMGRVNYGAGALYDYKGLLTAPPVRGNWSATCLPLRAEQVTALPFAKPRPQTHTHLAGASGPIFRRGTLRLNSAPRDTFLDTAGLSKGFVWVNGHALGRFWETAGPQHTLYLPAPFLRAGDNDVILLDLDGAATASIVSVAAPRYA
jgi:hypothetical protein